MTSSASKPGEPQFILLKYKDDPWAVVVVSQLTRLSQTTDDRTRAIIDRLFELWPMPQDLATADGRLENLLQPLGMWASRAATVRACSRDCAAGLRLNNWSGLDYEARQAVDVLCYLHVELRPTDPNLARWARWRREGGDDGEAR